LKRIGLYGCGAIGTQIALAIDSGKIPATLTLVYDIERSQADNLVSKLKQKPEVVANSHLLSSNSVELVVGCITGGSAIGCRKHTSEQKRFDDNVCWCIAG